MNYRYLRVIVTCAIVGTITLALKQNNQGNIPTNKLPDIKTSVDIYEAPLAAAPKKKVSTITIKPHISSEDLKVHKFGTHSPKSILLTVNDQEMEINNEDPITVKIDSSKKVTTRCKYAFVMNHKGENISTWQVEPKQQYDVSFSWDVPEKITLNGQGAKLIETHKLTPEQLKESDKKNTHKKRK